MPNRAPGTPDEETSSPVTRARQPRQVATKEAGEVADLGNAISTVDATAEAAVLSTVFASPDVFDEISERLGPDDFGVLMHSQIYRAMETCSATGKPIDTVTVAHELIKSGAVNKVSGAKAVDAVIEQSPAFEEINAYVDLIRDRAVRRQLLTVSREVGARVLSGADDATDLVQFAEQKIFAVGSGRGAHVTPDMRQVTADLRERAARSRNSLLTGMSTGFTGLDHLLGGLTGGQLIIVAGRPGTGKSVLSMQLSRHISEVNNVVVPFLSYEMSQEEIGFRMWSAATGIDLRLLQRGHIPDGMDAIAERELERMSQLPLLLDDVPPLTASGVRSAMRKLARRAPIGAIAVDYLQLLGGEGNRVSENRNQEVTAITRALKLLAKELNVPVIAGSQLSRGIENRVNRRPMLSDLRESGSIEQDADIVIFIHRDNTDPENDTGETELIIAKHRNGALGSVPVQFEGRCTRFRDLGPDARPAVVGGQPAPAARNARRINDNSPF